MFSFEPTFPSNSVKLIYGKTVAICDQDSYFDYTSKHHVPVFMFFICGYSFFVAVRRSVWRTTTVDEIRSYCILYYHKHLEQYV